jgi:hypothetical protein
MTTVRDSSATMKYRLFSVLAGLLVIGAGERATRAQKVEVDEPTPPPQATEPASAATSAGAFLPQTLSARIGSVPIFAYGSGGFDSTRRGPLVESAVEARVWGPFALRFQATYSNGTGRMRPSVAGRVQLLTQERHGVDGTLTVFFKTEGFTEAEGEIETFASIARRFRWITLIGNLVYGQDPEGNERDGEVHAAAFHQGRWLMLGIDSRVRFALGTQRGRAATAEPVLDFMAGPVATVVAGAVAIFAQAGPSGFELANSSARVGVAALAGLGAAY